MGIEAGTAMLIGSLAAAGGSVAAASMAGGDGASFAPRDLYRELTDTIRAQEETAGRTFALESEYQPRYQQLNLSTLRGMLLGQEGGERLEYFNEFVPATQRASGRYVDSTGRLIDEMQYRSLPVMQQRNYSPEMVMEGGYNQTRSRMVPTEQTPGLLDLLREVMPEIDELTQESTDRQRLNEAESIAKVGPEYLRALRQVNPDQTLLRDVLFGQAQEELDGELTPFERRQFQQSYRDSSRGRLGDTGQAGAAAESFYMQDRQYDRKKAGQDFATRMIGLDQALYGDPMLQITGRSGGTVPLASSILTQGQQVGAGAGPQYFDPMNSYAADLYNTNTNMAGSASIAAANRKAGLIGGGMNMFGDLLGGALQGGLFNKKPANN